MSWSILQSWTGTALGNNTISAAPPNNITSGSKFLIVCQFDSSVAQSITGVNCGAGGDQQAALLDDYNWSLTGRTDHTYVWALDCPVGSVGTKPTFNVVYSAAGTNSALFVEVAGLATGMTTALLDGTPGHSTGGDAGVTSPFGPPSYSSSATNELLFYFLGDAFDGLTWTGPAGYTMVGLDSATFGSVQLAYKNSTSGTETGTFSWSGGGTYSGSLTMVALKLPSGPNVSVTPAVVACAAFVPISGPLITSTATAVWHADTINNSLNTAILVLKLFTGPTQVQSLIGPPVISSANTSVATSATWSSSNITTGNRIIVYVNGYSNGDATTTVGVTDSAGNVYTKVVGGINKLEAVNRYGYVAQFSAPITAGGGTKPTITVTCSGTNVVRGIVWSAEEVAGLSTASGTGCIDVSAVGALKGVSSSADQDSGTTTAATAGGEYVATMVADLADNTTVWSVTSSSPTVTLDPGLTQVVNGKLDIAVAHGVSVNGVSNLCTWHPNNAESDIANIAVYKVFAASVSINATPSVVPCVASVQSSAPLGSPSGILIPPGYGVRSTHSTDFTFTTTSGIVNAVISGFESASAPEAVVRSPQSLTRATSGTAAASEVVGQGLIRAVLGTASATDLVVRGSAQGYLRPLPGTASATDSVLRGSNRSTRAPLEAATSSEVLARSRQSLTRTLSEATGVSVVVGSSATLGLLLPPGYGTLATTTHSLDATFTTAISAPIVSLLTVASQNPTTEFVSWTTNTPANSRIDYGLTTAYELSFFDPALTTIHAVTLSDLTPGTLYHYRITTSNGTATVSADFTLTSAPTGATISALVVSNVTSTSALISWTTDTPSDSQVFFGEASGTIAAGPFDSVYGTSHTVHLSGLTPSTLYNYFVRSSNGTEVDSLLSSFATSISAENLLSTPSLSGVMVESGLYQTLGVGLTDRLFILGHSDALALNDPYQVTDIRQAVIDLQYDSTSTLVRGMIEAYYSGNRDIWLISVAPQSEYQADPTLRDTAYYSTYASRLQVCYDLLLNYDLPQIIIPMEAPFYDAKGVDFLTPLAQHCEDAFLACGAMRLGFLGTRLGRAFQQSDVDIMTSDPRLALQGSAGKYIAVFVGEGTINLKEMPTSYVSSVVTGVAAQLSTMSFTRGIINIPIPNIVDISGSPTPGQLAALADAQLNPMSRTTKGTRGQVFQVIALTDNTLGLFGTDFWSLAQVRVVQQVLDRVRSLGRRTLGTVGLGQYKQSVQNYLLGLVTTQQLRGFGLDVSRSTLDKSQVNVNVSLTPYFGVRSLSFTATVGPGA